MHAPSRWLWLPALLLATVSLGVCSQRFAPRGQTSAEERTGPPAASEVPPAQRGLLEPRERPSGSRRPHAPDARLTEALEAEVARALSRVRKESGGEARPEACTISYRVIDLASGAVLAERQPTVPHEPASNMKLVTTLAALLALGPEWTFQTHVDAVGPIRDGVLEGDLAIRAAGDPFYATGRPEDATARLAELARTVARDRGVRRVQGDLLLDLTGWAEPEAAPGWPRASHWTESYALAAGLSLQGGLVTVTSRATRPGERCAVTLAPDPCGLSFRNELACEAGSNNDVRFGVYDDARRFTVSGTMGERLGEFVKPFRHPCPPEMFGAAFEAELVRAGVSVSGAVREVRGVPTGRRLATSESRWIDLLEPINTDSVNSVADGVLMAMGRARSGEGTREAGARVVAEVLRGLGVDLEGFRQADGSGLSRDNRVHAQLLSELLVRALELSGTAPQRYLDSLAVAGETGTLDDRMRDGPARGRVKAKSGWIQGASSLSGVADTLDGRRLVFSILVNYPRVAGLNTTVWKPMQDAQCEALVTSGAGAGRVR